MFILLKEGEKRLPGDQMCCGAESWYNPCDETWKLWEQGYLKNAVRRELKGWDAVNYAIKTELTENMRQAEWN